MPAPFRWVIGKPGDPADETESTNFGPWFQPADQAADAVTLNSAPEPQEVGGVFESYDDSVLDPPAPDDDPDVETTELAVALTLAGDAGYGLSEGELSVSHTSWTLVAAGDPDDDDPFQILHVLHGHRSGDGTTIAASPQDLFWKDAWRPDWPAGAVGYEVELAEPTSGDWFPIAEPLSVSLDVTLAPTTFNGNVTNAEAIAVLNTLWGEGPVEFAYAGPLLDLTIQRVAPATLAAAEDDQYGRVAVAVPIAGALDPPYVETVTITDLSESPPYTGLVGLHSTVKNYDIVHVDDGNTLVVSANASVTGVYTIRPPRIRWIYDRQPYRRAYPRDDALAGGAQRTWPPSKAIQSSSRTFGGYL